MNWFIFYFLVIGVFLIQGCNVQTSSFEIVDIPEINHNNLTHNTTKPLKENVLLQIPLGNIKAKGWLQNQLDLMLDGYIGRLNEISPYLNKNSGWLGGEERGWEEAPYWLRGFYDLAILTNNPRIDSIAQQWIEAVLTSADEDGYYGSSYNKMVVSTNGKDTIIDLWPNMVMNDALISHYEATHDERVISILTKFFNFCMALTDKQYLSQISWDYYENYKEYFGDWKPRIQLKRAGDFIPQIYWLYKQTGDAWLLDFALKTYQKTQPPMNQWLDNHGVHFMQRFRYPAQMYPLTGDNYYLDQSDFFYNQMMQTWGQLPRGAISADERIRNGKFDPGQGFESCAIVEGAKSFYILGNITGKTEYADKIEDLIFNWLPASQTPDLKALRYFTAANMAYSVQEMDYQKTIERKKSLDGTSVFAADKHRCCQHNTSMGWPWFIKNMWKTSSDNGLVAWLYGPNELNITLGKERALVHVVSSTNYPFADKINLKFNLINQVEFPLYLRIPGWANKLVVKINGENQFIENENGRYIKINRYWKDNDEIIIEFKPEISFTEWPRTKSVSVNRGPFTFSVFIKENWVKLNTNESGWGRWEILPASDWNYGIPLDEIKMSEIQVKTIDKLPFQPWDTTEVPISLKIQAKKIPGWTISVKNTVDPLREGPIRSDEKMEWIEMIPMGAAHLRLTCMPVISNQKNARYWENIPDPNQFMLN